MRIRTKKRTKLKKFTLSIFLIFGLNYYLFSQEYEFNLYYQDSCNDQTEFTLNFFLEKDGFEFHPTFEKGVVKLKSKGQYNLIHEHQTIPITIDKEHNSYTIIPTEIQEFIVNDKYGYEFRDCENPLNGNVLGYFENQQIKIIGTFKKGHSIGYLTEFYANGELKKIRLFDKKGFLIETIVSND